MNIVNNFRYGEISKKCAGRFDAEFYNQGAFEYKNMLTGPMGEAMRRPPLKFMLSADILDIREFTISDELSYIIGLGENKLHIYRYVGGVFSDISNVAYPHKGDEPAITLDLKTAREIRICQYYERMYFVHHTFRPFYIDIEPATNSVSASYVQILLNQYAKDDIWFTPSVVKDSEGKELPNFEGRRVYKKSLADGSVEWYFKKDGDEYSDKYEYAVNNAPIKGSKTYIQNYEEAQDDTLLTGAGNFPSEVACINDCLYFAATDNNPQVIWKSRVLGSSQFIDGYTADSMHDFITFQIVQSEGKDLVEPSEFPMTDMKDPSNNPIYQTDMNGNIIYYGIVSVPKLEGGQPVFIDGEQVFVDEEKRVWFKPVNTFYTSPSFAEGTEYTGETKKVGNKWYGTDTQGEDIEIYLKETKEWFMDEGFTIPYTGTTQPYGKPLKIYDVSDPNKLMKTVCRIDFVVTDSCGDRIEINNGRHDKIMFIRPACGKIIVGTTNSEETLPADFSPVSNRSREHYSDYGTIESYNISPVCMDSSFFFLQRSNVLREMFLYQGFISKKDVSVINHDILDGAIASIDYKNTPTPQIFIVKEDGSVVVLTYDKDNGIQAFSRWDSEGSIMSTAKIVEGNRHLMLALIDYKGEKQICYFDEDEKEIYRDSFQLDGKDEELCGKYISRLTTPYVEIIDNQFLGFGSFKKSNTAYIRCFDTGHIEVGDDLRQMSRTPYKLESTDYKYTLKGTAQRQYSVIIQSVDVEPMNILAFGFEVIK